MTISSFYNIDILRKRFIFTYYIIYYSLPLFSILNIFIKIHRVYIIICFAENVDREQEESVNSLIDDDSPQSKNEYVQGCSEVISNTSLSTCKCCLGNDRELRKLQIRTIKLEKLFEMRENLELH